MKKLNIAVCGLMFAAATATLVSCQDIVTYKFVYSDSFASFHYVFVRDFFVVFYVVSNCSIK